MPSLTELKRTSICVSKAATIAPQIHFRQRTQKEVDMNPNKKLMVVVATFMCDLHLKIKAFRITLKALSHMDFYMTQY
jgi:hypothetical protein